MSKLFHLVILMSGSIISYGQNISVTFTGTGAATEIDSLKATNLATNQSVALPGNDTLVLTVNTGIPSGSELTDQAIVFPNPFSGQAKFSAIVQNAQTVHLKVQNLVGQVVAQTTDFVPPGENEFTLSLATGGIYVVTLTTDQGTASYKVICTGADALENNIQYLGSRPDNHKNSLPPGIKSSGTKYTLRYALGDVILYSCKSGIFTCVIADSPTTSKNYLVEFVACTDPDGKNYPVVKIGDQTWMAENLAYLPSVSTPASGSDSSPFFYVYNFDGTKVSTAKSTKNYSTYGVLYNWEAAKTACPAGWHLPNEAEWTVLTNFLGSGPGGKLKETGTLHWTDPNTGATNEKGFTALPGGLRTYPGSFNDLGNFGYFWTAAAGDATHAWVRIIANYDPGMGKYSVVRNRGYSVRCLLGQSAGLAKVTTTDITAVTDISASGGGNVTSDGGNAVTGRGICWNNTGAPKITDNKTTDGSGVGTFTSTLTGLISGTLYYVRAYATNSAGTAYGSEVSFKTSSEFMCGSSITIDHVAGIVAPVNKTVTYGTVDNIPGEESKCWITSNLGADGQATAVDDATEASAGWYWQFNRLQGYMHDGTTRTPNTTWLPDITEGFDWQTDNDPCALELGNGWRIPTMTEWTNVNAVSGGNWTNGNSAWNSGLKLHAAGYLRYTDAFLMYRGSEGVYWSSTRYSLASGWAFVISNDYTRIAGGRKAYAYSVRCLRDCSSTLDIPTSGTHVPSQTQIIWNWNSVKGATGYKGNITNDYGTAVDMGTDTTYVETGLTCGTAYTRYLWAYNDCGYSEPGSTTQSTLDCSSCGSSITIDHVAGTVAPVTKTVTYGTVTNIPGEPSKCWITSNLGADRQATAVTDASEASAGWYWQFNRKRGFKYDGTTRTPNITWISSVNENSDWTADNDPCLLELGTDWRIPTYTEWENADGVNGGNWTNRNGPWNSELKLHAAGCLFPTNGSIMYRGSYGYYWSSTQSSSAVGWSLAFDSGGSSIYYNDKAAGLPLRCIK